MYSMTIINNIGFNTGNLLRELVLGAHCEKGNYMRE